jgi:hypothetical protein
VLTLTTTVDEAHVTATEVIVGAGVAACTVTLAVPDLLVSCALVAVKVTVPAVGGAVKSPPELIVPALAVHITVEL